MQEGDETDDCCGQEAVELNIVILVDGEEKCCSKVTASKQGCASSQCSSCGSSRPNTSPSCAQLENQQVQAVPSVVDQCGNTQPEPPPQTQCGCACPCQSFNPCGGGAPVSRPINSASCQTISYGECQTDPIGLPPCTAPASYAPPRTATASCTDPVPAPPCTAPPVMRVQTATSCQTGVDTVPPSTAPPAYTPSRAACCQTGTDAPPRVQKPKKCCKKKPKSAMCQTAAPPAEAPVVQTVCPPKPACQPQPSYHELPPPQPICQSVQPSYHAPPPPEPSYYPPQPVCPSYHEPPPPQPSYHPPPQQLCQSVQPSYHAPPPPQPICPSVQPSYHAPPPPQQICASVQPSYHAPPPPQPICGPPQPSYHEPPPQQICASVQPSYHAPPPPQPICGPPQPSYHEPLPPPQLSQLTICPPPPPPKPICPPPPKPVCPPKQKKVCPSKAQLAQPLQPAEASVQQFEEAVQKEEEQPPPQPEEQAAGEGARPHHLHEPAEAKKARRSSLPPDQLNFSHFPPVQLSFVDYFLKAEGGVASVISLAETKLEFEKKCKHLLANMPNHKRDAAEQFFNKIIEAIQTKVPDSNNTEIKHYHLGKYLHPICSALQLDVPDELHVISKYHSYIISVVSYMEDKIREGTTINPDALVDVETHLLAGIMSRFYPLFIKIKEAAINMSKGASAATVPPDEFIKQLRKFILAQYVEIVCIDNTFNNTLNGLTYLPSADVQEKYRHHMAIRKKHARHSVTWAARCLTTSLLYYYATTAL